LSDELLARLSAWSKVQMICIRFSHCHPIVSCFVKIQNGLTFPEPAYPVCPGKEAAKLVSALRHESKLASYSKQESLKATNNKHKQIWRCKYSTRGKGDCLSPLVVMGSNLVVI